MNITAFLDYLLEQDRAERTIVAVLLHGLRVSEVCDLELADNILLPRRGLVIVRSDKGGLYREVPLNKDARQALQSRLNADVENRIAA
jgi:integrase